MRCTPPTSCTPGSARHRTRARPTPGSTPGRASVSRATTPRLSRALHDHAIEAELDALLRDRRTVGVMGGHAVARDSRRVRRGSAAWARAVTRAGLLVASGGGPGAMEAANLGAYLANAPRSTRSTEAIAMLRRPSGLSALDHQLGARGVRRPSALAATAPTRSAYRPGSTAMSHRTRSPSHIAKFFRNALREDMLLSRCDAGIVFLPGAAGTVQEIFQDACENYYADEATIAPMVLVGISTGPRTSRPGRCSIRWRTVGRCRVACISSTRSTTRWRLLG